MLYLASSGSFLLGLLHTRGLPLEYFTKRSFRLFITVVLLILFKVPLVALTVLNFTVGYYLFSRRYYLFEPYRGPRAVTSKQHLSE
jgi:hypothetical protein